jgi:uncharacterized protein (TIGR02145 family)
LNDLVTKYNITTMQTLGSTACKAVTYDASNNGVNTHNTVTLTDIRNSQKYLVRKLADGNCWMINNLKLGSTTEEIILTPSTTNTINVVFHLPMVTNDFNSTTPSYAYPQWYDPTCGATNAPASPNCGNADINSDHFYGYYYNWCAATARGLIGGEAGSKTCTEGDTMPVNATQDICPKGWRMPSGSGAWNSTSNEFGQLNIAMFGSSSLTNSSNYDDASHVAKWQYTGAWKSVFSGVRNHGMWHSQGVYTDVWTSSAYPGDSKYALFIYIAANGIIIDNHSHFRTYGRAVRCLVK